MSRDVLKSVMVLLPKPGLNAKVSWPCPTCAKNRRVWTVGLCARTPASAPKSPQLFGLGGAVGNIPDITMKPGVRLKRSHQRRIAGYSWREMPPSSESMT
jgi:hypothetical protein